MVASAFSEVGFWPKPILAPHDDACGDRTAPLALKPLSLARLKTSLGATPKELFEGTHMALRRHSKDSSKTLRFSEGTQRVLRKALKGLSRELRMSLTLGRQGLSFHQLHKSQSFYMLSHSRSLLRTRSARFGQTLSSGHVCETFWTYPRPRGHAMVPRGHSNIPGCWILPPCWQFIIDFILLSGLGAFPGRKPEDKPEGQCARKETGRPTKVKPEDKPEGE